MKLNSICEKLASKLLTHTMVECMKSPIVGINGGPKKGRVYHSRFANKNGYLWLSAYSEGWISTNFRKAQA